VADVDLSGKVALITGGSRGIVPYAAAKGAAIYFASDASTYTTDSIIRVDGGTK
jgi:NAD(P)-dependent dehydrogenase (short-subunit alcohol dehydrogenase family)